MTGILIILGLFGTAMLAMGLHNQSMQTRKIGLILLGVALGLLFLNTRTDISIFPGS